MAEWTVQTDRLDALAQRMEQCTRTLREIQSDVNAVRGSLQFRLQGSAALNRNLQALCQQIEQEAGKNHQLSVAMQRAARQYQTTEGKLGGDNSAPRWGKRRPTPHTGATDEEAGERKVPEWVDAIFKLLGPVGDVAGIGGDLYEGKKGEALGSTIKLLGDGIKANKDGGGFPKWFENFFDTAAVTKEELLDKAHPKNAKDFLFGTKAKPTAVMGTLVSWAGEGIVSWFGNKDRINKTDSDYIPHVITTTLVETGIKIAEKAAVEWAVASVLGTVCAATGPAGWVVGATAAAATIAIDWGLDWVARKVTGNPEIKWTQAVGDGVYKAGKKVYEKANKVGKAITKKGGEVVKWAGDTARSVGNAISNAWGSVCRWVTG